MKKENKIELTTVAPIDKTRAFAKAFFSLRTLGIAFFCVTVFLIGYYILFPSRGFFHSDSADTQMWAKAAYDAGALVNPDFEYACLLPLGGQLLMLPFIPIFGVSMTTQVIGMLLFFIVFTAALLFMFKQMKLPIGASCFATACVLLMVSGSEKLREIFWGHVIYYSLGLLYLFVGLGLLFKFLDHAADTSVSAKKRILIGGLMFVWGTMAAVNQFEILTLCSLPLIGGLIAERFFDFSRSLSRRETILNLMAVALMFSAVAVGYLLGDIIVGGVEADYAGAYSAFSDPNDWFDNISHFLVHWTSLFGVEIANGDPIADLEGALQLIKFLTSLVLLIAPVVATVLYPKLNDRRFRILILAHWISTALIIIGYVIGRLSAANWRLSPILATSAVVTVALCHWCYRHRPAQKRLALLAIVPIVAVGAMTAKTILDMEPDIHQDSGLYAVSEAMQENGWDYGYATFWNANALTVISDSAVECRSISLNGSNYSEYFYQQEHSWFEDQPGQETYFVLMDAGEFHAAQSNASPLYAKAVDIYQVENFYVLLYDRNIFPHL